MFPMSPSALRWHNNKHMSKAINPAHLAQQQQQRWWHNIPPALAGLHCLAPLSDSVHTIHTASTWPIGGHSLASSAPALHGD